MKKEIKILFLAILITLALISFNKIKETLASIEDNQTLVAQTTAEQESKNDTLVVLEENVSYWTKRFITKNGLELEIGYVRNLGESREIEVYINVIGGKWITFKPFIKENETWSYARIAGFAVLPKSSGLIINENETSYYKMNKQLRISFEGKGNEILIYSEKRPTRIVSMTNIRWGYDSEKRMIYIYRSDSDGKITVDFTEYPIANPLVIEDRSREEELLYELEKIKASFKELDMQEYNLLKEIAFVQNASMELQNKIKEKESEKASLLEKIENENNKKSELEKIISEHYLVTSAQIGLVATLFIILVIYAIYINIRVGEKDEEK